MPEANKFIKQDTTLRIMSYGPAKSRKTWWALKAAEAGFRVLVFDFDRGADVVSMLTPEARERVYVFEAYDEHLNAFASVLMTVALKEFYFYADEKTRRISRRPAEGLHFYDLRSFGRDTVIVFDSYTALANSVARQYAFENNIDLSDAEKPEWEGYRWCGALLTWMLTQMKALPCNYIVVGHETSYEKYKKRKGQSNKQGELLFTRRQIASSSNPHGMSIPDKFSDVLYFYNSGQKTWIETIGDKNADAGSRHIPPGKYDWDELTFGKLAELSNIPLPEKVTPFNFPVVEQQQANPLSSKKSGNGEDKQPTPVIKPSSLQSSRSSILFPSKR